MALRQTVSWGILLRATPRYVLVSHVHRDTLLYFHVRDALAFLVFFSRQTTFYIILSTAGMTLDTKEIDIDLQLQT